MHTLHQNTEGTPVRQMAEGTSIIRGKNVGVVQEVRKESSKSGK